MDATHIPIVTALIAAAAALLGTAVGGWIVAKNQQIERRQKRVSEQLAQFYGPMLGMRERMLAKAAVLLKLSGAADSAWRKRFEGARDIDRIEKLMERWPAFETVIRENNRQFVEEIVPLYRQMVDHFTAHMALAEASTREHFGELVSFVDMWDRWLEQTIPHEAMALLEHSEEKIMPLYADLEKQFDRLSQELKE